MKLGPVQTRDVQMTDREGQDLLAFDRLTVDMADVRPLEQVVNLTQVELLKPVLHAQRDAAGRLNLAQLSGGPAPASPRRKPPATRQVIHQSRRALGGERGARQRARWHGALG